MPTARIPAAGNSSAAIVYPTRRLIGSPLFRLPDVQAAPTILTEAAMAYEFVVSEPDGPVGVVTLNRPRQRNALSSALLAELADALEAHDADENIRAIVLTGGTEVFAAGA